ncbi:helix-turn-helix transcriptional regulator [Micromonospora phytophila]|uniref:winged helix-turn-helix transcriptional regulator n=1 Tax=Micromonospora phytophila TaxID=709888 RepID=UPI00202F333C|nr:helix-turn-helix domain-containing protein [Micromonospora phytophila]MCM0674511.1 helix-turn-helix transcriptional regulator [Micromonospora phytophila]
MAALDLFGRRWSLRIVWELRDSALGFRALQRRCEDMSSSVLRQRLTELADARIVEQLTDASYTLTPLGHEAYHALRPLIRWSDKWSTALAETASPSGEAGSGP